MLGAIIGDIVGSIYEWNNIKTKDFAAVLDRLPDMDLTDDDLLQETLWDAGAEAYRKGWEINRIEDEI